MSGTQKQEAKGKRVGKIGKERQKKKCGLRTLNGIIQT